MGMKRHQNLKIEIGEIALLSLSNQGFSSYNVNNMKQFLVGEIKKILNNDN